MGSLTCDVIINNGIGVLVRLICICTLNEVCILNLRHQKYAIITNFNKDYAHLLRAMCSNIDVQNSFNMKWIICL